MQRELRAQERERQELMRLLFGKSVSAITKKAEKIAPPPAPVRINPYDSGVNNMIRHHIIEFFLKPENMEQLLKEMHV